ncbi:MAG: hypothetical protein KBB54_03445 [Candidatus Pacebacteria bacterium]|nr:hypothetical protein [Candidatus Paceibacterota bacterium]
MKVLLQLIWELFGDPNYGVSNKNEVDALTPASYSPTSVRYGVAGIDLSTQHRQLLIWKRTRHREWIIFLIIPLYKWVDDEISLVGEIGRGGGLMKITTFDTGFSDDIHRQIRSCRDVQNNLENTLVIETVSSVPEHTWGWNDARQQWTHLPKKVWQGD